MHDFKGVAPEAKAPKDAKNVLMIVVDDLRPQLNLAYGHSFMKTPNLDEFAQSTGAVTFTRAYAQVAHCAPSRNSFMTSRYPDSLKIWNVNTDFRARATPAAPIFPIPHWFKRNGYLVFGGGKIYHPNHPKENDKPFSWSAGTKLGGEVKYFNDADHGCPDSPGENKVGCAGCVEDKPDEEFYDGKLANWTIQTLQDCKQDALSGEKRPFFIAAGFRRPHTPWNVAKRFVDMYPEVDPPKHPGWAEGAPPCAFVCGGDGVGCDFGVEKQREAAATSTCRRTYYACVSATDHYVGTVLSELSRLELKQNTIVAIFGDHGWHLGEGGLWAKYTNMELATRVPLMIRAPWLSDSQKKHLAARLDGDGIAPVTARDKLEQLEQSKHDSDGVIRSKTFVELVDIYPTLVDLARIPSPPHLEGRSLKNAMLNPLEIKHRAMSQSQFAHCCPWGSFDAHRECGACEKLPNDRISYMGYAVRNDEYRFVAWYRWDTHAALPSCGGLMAVELYKHSDDDGLGDSSFDDFEAVNLAANITLGAASAEMHRDKLRVRPRGRVQTRLGQVERLHANAIKNLHEDLLNKFSTAFGRCLPAVAVRQHRQKPLHEGMRADKTRHGGTLDPSEGSGGWPPDTTCPNPE